MNLVSKTSDFPDAPISKEGYPWQPANYLFANGLVCAKLHSGAVSDVQVQPSYS